MKNINLRDEKAAIEALEQVRAASDLPRTQYFEIANAAPQFNLTLVLAEGYQDAGSVPSGYEKDTGLTVTGTNVAPGTTQKGIIQPQINVQVTFAKCSLHWKRAVEPFDEGDLALPDATAPAGKFFIFVGWTVSESAVPGKRPSIIGKKMTMPLIK